MAARDSAPARGTRGAPCDCRVRARGRPATVGRTRGHRRRTRVAGVADGALEGSLVLLAPQRARATRVEPIRPFRSRLPALVRRSRRDLHAGAAPRGTARGLPGAEAAAPGDRDLHRLRNFDCADSLVAVPRDSSACCTGELGCGAGGRPAARPRDVLGCGAPARTRCGRVDRTGRRRVRGVPCCLRQGLRATADGAGSVRLGGRRARSSGGRSLRLCLARWPS